MIDAAHMFRQITLGEDSRRQFKRNIQKPSQLAAELVAFVNSGGGSLFVGVDDDGGITGVEPGALRKLNMMVSNVATDMVKPSIPIKTYTEFVDEKVVLLIEVPDGLNKPYCDNEGRFWVKQGADKRKVVAPEELQRMFQAGQKLYADERSVIESSISDLDIESFGRFYKKKYGVLFENADQPLGKILEALGLKRDGHLTLAAILLFSKKNALYCPLFKIQACAVQGATLVDDDFLDKQECDGRLSAQFTQALNFVRRNLHAVSDHESGFNQPGQTEISIEAVSELLVNALVHRDYFINASTKLFIFNDRLEIHSPGVLPNTLTVLNIKQGISLPRNSILLSHAQHVLPYSGLGSGIPRVLKHCPNTTFKNDLDMNRFVVSIPREI